MDSEVLREAAEHLHQAALKLLALSRTDATSPVSSAQSRGPAPTPSVSSTETPVAGTENPQEMFTLIRQAIMDYSRSTESISPAWLETSIGSSTLQLTFTWPGAYTEMPDSHGPHGHVAPEVR